MVNKNSDSLVSMHETISNLTAVRGKGYTSILLASLNTMMVTRACVAAVCSETTKEQQEYIAEACLEGFRGTASLLAKVILPTQTAVELREMVKSLEKDFMPLAEQYLRVLAEVEDEGEHK